MEKSALELNTFMAVIDMAILILRPQEFVKRKVRISDNAYKFDVDW